MNKNKELRLVKPEVGVTSRVRAAAEHVVKRCSEGVSEGTPEHDRLTAAKEIVATRLGEPMGGARLAFLLADVQCQWPQFPQVVEVQADPQLNLPLAA